MVLHIVIYFSCIIKETSVLISFADLGNSGMLMPEHFLLFHFSEVIIFYLKFQILEETRMKTVTVLLYTL